MEVRQRIEALREKMRSQGLTAYFVPSTDPHQSEYVPDCWQRRPWISGFTGSAGDVVVTLDGAGLWTDGRYFLQAESELAGTGIDLYRMGQPGVPTVDEFLGDHVGAGDCVGCDPRVLSVSRARSLQAAVEAGGGKLKLLRQNLVDAVWKQQPGRPEDPVLVQPTRYAGETARSKLKRLREEMRTAECDAHVLSTLDTIMWLLNLRGRDVEYNPVAICYLVVRSDDATLYIDETKVQGKARRAVERVVDLRPYGDFQKVFARSGSHGRGYGSTKGRPAAGSWTR